MNKKAGILQENVVYLILVVIFFAGMMFFVLAQTRGSYNWSDYYAKELAKLINLAQPGDEITLDIHKATEIAQKNTVQFSQIFLFDNPNNKVCVQLSYERKVCYSFYNDVDIIEPEIKLGVPINILKFKISKVVKNHPSQMGDMKMPHSVWFLSMLRIPRMAKPLVTDEWNSDI